jgi:hypothetical protein
MGLELGIPELAVQLRRVNLGKKGLFWVCWDLMGKMLKCANKRKNVPRT